MLFQLDKDWREHLAAMDMLRGSVNLRAMGGKDPFFEYKRESFDYFDEMLSNQNQRVLKRIENQWTDEQRIAKSNYVIHNLSVESTKKQVDEILKKLKNQ